MVMRRRIFLDIINLESPSQNQHHKNYYTYTNISEIVPRTSGSPAHNIHMLNTVHTAAWLDIYFLTWHYIGLDKVITYEKISAAFLRIHKAVNSQILYLRSTIQLFSCHAFYFISWFEKRGIMRISAQTRLTIVYFWFLFFQ